MARPITNTALPRYISSQTCQELYRKAQERGLDRDHGLVTYGGRGRYARIAGGWKYKDHRVLVIDVPITREGMMRRTKVGVAEEDMPWLRTRLRDLPEGALGPPIPGPDDDLSAYR